jgi:succinylglutamate desuccinylase
VIAVGGIHGNEPAGVHALERVVAAVERSNLSVVGSFVAVAGNLGGLARNQRFLDRDLNRAWTADQVAALRAQDPGRDTAEDREQRALLDVFEECLARARGPVVFLDLHSSSAAGASFSCLADTIPNRHLAMSLPVPTILGLEECIDGAVMEFFSERGLTALAIEGGQHADPRTVDNLEAAVWLTLVATGVLARGEVDTEGFHRTLRASAQGAPAVLQVRHRHVVRPEQEFVMEPGYRSFQTVTKGELLARQADRDLRAGENGHILLPLYQGQGEDGYFLCRSVRPFWLHVARALRALHLDAPLRWLPGVRRDPQDRDALLVSPVLARFLAVQIFHLLGFRKRRRVGEQLRFSRRRVHRESWSLRPRP